MTARIHGISRSIASHAIRPLKSGYAVADVVQLIDGSHGAGLNALSRTLFLALDRRDRAIEDIRVLAPDQRPARCAGRRSPSW